MFYGKCPMMPFQGFRQGTDKECCDYRMTVHGKGSVRAVPDKASIILGVVTEGSKLKSIQQENARTMNQILGSLKRLGIDDKDIGTQSYDIDLIYDYINNKQVFKGYRVRNTIKVSLDDVQKAGEVIDAAVSSGANLAENIEFTVSDQDALYRRALSLAVLDAAENAAAIEKTLDIVLDRIPVNITEEVSSLIPIGVKASVKAYGSATPVKPGLIDITANVRAVFDYRKSVNP
jgi:uncharacterized protein YggE